MVLEWIHAFLISQYAPTTLIHIISWIPFWIAEEDSKYDLTSEVPKEKIPTDEFPTEKTPNYCRSQRFRLSLMCLVWMLASILIGSMFELKMITSCLLNYIWIVYMLITSSISFYHVCKLEKGQSFGSKPWITYPLAFILFNLIYWPLSFICVLKNTNFC